MCVQYHSMRKKSRIYIRVEWEKKREYKKAAKAAGMTLSEWVLKRLEEILRDLNE